jgi:hypothetical protein
VSFAARSRLVMKIRSIAGRRSGIVVALFAAIAGAELPPALPGDEISQEYLNWTVPKDTAKVKLDTKGTSSANPWLDKVQKTWEAPTLAEQMSASNTFVPMGKGGIFIPRLSSATGEPEIEILSSSGRSVISGGTGRLYSVEPGKYSCRLGSGTHIQRIVRIVDVEEAKTVPLVPDWSGLSIETVDSTTTPFRGEYELVRIDEFEAYGRGFGANPDLGEAVKTWILKPGIYKVLTMGQGYNSLINFVTVRLVPGELTKLLLVENPSDFKILGGGTVEVAPKTKIASNWKYGANIGGSIIFNSNVNRVNNGDTTISTLFGLLSTLWLKYQAHPYEWQSRIRFNEGFTLSSIKSSSLRTDANDFLLNSLFIWRIFSWLGPYGNADIHTNLLPKRIERGQKKYFCILNSDSTIANPKTGFDSSTTHQTQSSFTPLQIDFGAGVNADVLNFSFLEMKLRAGFGSQFLSSPFQYQNLDTSAALWKKNPDTTYLNLLKNSICLYPEAPSSVFESGPQASITGTLRIGRVITTDGELDMFMPITPKDRFLRPDFNILANVSWRLSRWITLDYTYQYQLTQTENNATRVDKSTHGVWLRFSFSSR